MFYNIIHHHGADKPSRFEHSINEYALFAGKQPDHFIDAVFKYSISAGFLPVTNLSFFIVLLPDQASTNDSSQKIR